MDKKEKLAKEYCLQYDNFNFNSISEKAFEDGWDEALKSQWVSVKEELPERYKKVIVVYKYRKSFLVDVDAYLGEDVWKFGDRNIIAWMPIPSFDDILKNE